MSMQSEYDTTRNVLQERDFLSAYKWTNSLRGNIWRAVSTEDPSKKFLVKVTQDNIAYNNDNENIFAEQSVLKYLAQQEDRPQSVIKMHDFFQINHNCYLVMEDAGISLFDFVMKLHRLIRQKKISIAHLQHIAKVILKQMIEAIEYIHSKNICHFNISLESFLINDVFVEVPVAKDAKQYNICTDSMQIVLCDFGFSEHFTGSMSDCISSKFCGSQRYKSPEIMNRKEGFDAKRNDLWSMGVCFFMTVTGFVPWNTANETDAAFLYIVKYKKLMDVLHRWNIKHYANQNMVEIMQSLFEYEDDRATLAEIKRLPFTQ